MRSKPEEAVSATGAASSATTDMNGEGVPDLLAYNLAHDLQAPLRAIRGFAQIMAETPRSLDAEQRHFLDLIMANADRMHDLIEGLRKFHELSRYTPQRERLDMAALVARVVEERTAREPVDLAVIEVGALAPGRGDPDRIREVWAHLLDNALKFTRHVEEPEIEIGHEPATGAWYIRDNGAGFDMQRAGRLFMLFQRLHSADDFPGAGVGLALAQGIVRRHDGRIWAEATPDQGATFRFTLPAE